MTQFNLKQFTEKHDNNMSGVQEKPKKEVKQIMEGNQPASRVKAGGIEVTIWENSNKFGGTNTSVTMQRNYKDKQEQWQKTNNLKINDIPKAILALSKAYEKIVLKE